ncbi:MAG TPA: glycosyltransferase family 9 protein [Candidatus Limnocylindrales bacterium]|nr:glycosyltransferase family 9 protein [Candidatus Limnocylindrales bacterium]
MGDIIHTLPAVASLRHSFPASHLTWVVEPQWAPLLEENPFVDRVLFLRRSIPAGILESWRGLRSQEYDFAVDFQGLIKSALVASCSRADRIFGFHQSQIRERAAGLFYSNKTLSSSVHVVDRALDLAAAAGAANALRTFPLPPGRSEGELPDGEFVLASPLAGWRQKQWPMSHFARLAAMLRSEFKIPLVLNGAPGAPISQVRDAVPHFSGLAGLIHATRRATAVVGVDSGPMHLAAALGKPGVAIFGPTDPARNGPYGDSLRVVRSDSAITTYKRGTSIDESMRRISPEEIFEVLRAVLGGHREPAGCIA